jgi:hypothetical protein
MPEARVGVQAENRGVGPYTVIRFARHLDVPRAVATSTRYATPIAVLNQGPRPLTA